MNLDTSVQTETPRTAPLLLGMSRLLSSTGIHISVIIFLCLAIYSNTFHVPFILDDEGSIQLLPAVHGLANYFKDWDGYNYLPNRAFGYFTFALNYEFGGLNLPGYHMVNLVVHSLSGLLVYALVRLIFRTPFMQGAYKRPESVNIFAFIIALFFVCHPIQTQAVTYIVQRLTSMTAMFYLAALVCYLRWRSQACTNRPGWYLLTLLAILLAMKTKEISFTLPVMIVLFEVFFFGMPDRKQLVKMIPLFMTILLIPLTTYFKITPVIEAAGGKGSFLSDVNTQAYDLVQLTRPEYILTQLSVMITYLRLLLLPINQHLDYDYPITHTLFEPRPLLSLLLLLAIFVFAIYLIIKSRQHHAQMIKHQHTSTAPLLRLAALGIFWFFITISVESSIIVIKDVIYEHRLYLPSIGFFIFLVSFSTLAVKSLHSRFKSLNTVIFLVITCVIMTLSTAAYARNNVWHDWITFWSDNVTKAPKKGRPRLILGIGYYYKGDFENALQNYEKAALLKPNFIEAYYNIGLVHYARKEHKKAISMYMKVLGISAFDARQFAQTYNDIGICYTELENTPQALEAFATAVKYNPEFAEFRNNYGFALSLTGNRAEAIRQYQKALQLEPGNQYAMNALHELQTNGGNNSAN
jgi:tetratricopeptide (TPR) repeat protein